MAPHACEGPIGGVATIQVNAALPNFLVQEICGQVKPTATDKIWEELLDFPAMRMANGRFPLSEKPGLGFELSEASLQNIRLAARGPWLGSFTTMDRSQNGRGDIIRAWLGAGIFLF